MAQSIACIRSGGMHEEYNLAGMAWNRLEGTALFRYLTLVYQQLLIYLLGGGPEDRYMLALDHFRNSSLSGGVLLVTFQDRIILPLHFST